MSANQILVFSEKDALRRELLGKARREADALGWLVGAVVLEGDPTAASLGDAGADVIYKIPTTDDNPEQLIHLLAEVAHQIVPAFFLLGATKTGMEAAARLSERLAAAYAPWTVRFEIDPATYALTAHCMLYAGSGLATYCFKPGLVVITSAPGAFAKIEGAEKTASEVFLLFSIVETRLELLGSRPKVSGAANLEDARLVIDVGQGVRQREDLVLVNRLVELLDGQVACSRPISSDRDWFPDWLGLSGKKVRPELCLCVGISGAVQHLVGIRDSRLIAAVNNDENAPIFNQADYGVVADLYEFLPALTERLKARGLRPMWRA
jgi:electron transfer flavoprotein alpha subunit